MILAKCPLCEMGPEMHDCKGCKGTGAVSVRRAYRLHRRQIAQQTGFTLEELRRQDSDRLRREPIPKPG